jgi:Importin-beta N-terminal domain
MNSDPVRHASIQEVYAAVAGAASQNPKEMSTSAARLKDLMDQPGTLDLLQQIAAQRKAPLQIRQLSIIQVKNVVSTLWRSRRSVGLVLCLHCGTRPKLGVPYARLVLDDQRQAIRNRCLTLLEEEDDVVRYVPSIPLLDS